MSKYEICCLNVHTFLFRFIYIYKSIKANVFLIAGTMEVFFTFKPFAKVWHPLRKNFWSRFLLKVSNFFCYCKSYDTLIFFTFISIHLPFQTQSVMLSNDFWVFTMSRKKHKLCWHYYLANHNEFKIAFWLVTQV